MANHKSYTALWLLLLFLSLLWGGWNWIGKKACEEKQSFAQSVARKDSTKAVQATVRAKQANNRLLNYPRVDTAIVDSATGDAWVHIKGSGISKKPITTIVGPVSQDSVFYYSQGSQASEKKFAETERKYISAAQKKDDTIGQLKHERDSLLSVAFRYKDRNISITQVRKKDDDTDSHIEYRYNASLIPQVRLRKNRYFGMATWDTVPPKHGSYAQVSFTSSDTSLVFDNDSKDFDLYLYNPTLAIAGQITTNYNPSIQSWQIGPGLRVFYKGFNLYVPYYYNVTEGKWNRFVTFSVSTTVARWNYSSKKKMK